MKINKQAGFIPIIIALVLAVGLGGTVALANNSAPGDSLFGLDRAVENFRIKVAGTEKKNELRIAFADERVKEIERVEAKTPTTESSVETKANVTLGINSAIELLNGVSTSVDGESAVRLKLITDELNKYLNSLSRGSTVDVLYDDDKDKTRFELRTEDGRVHVEVKGGGSKIKIEGDNDSSISNRDSDSDDDIYGEDRKDDFGDDGYEDDSYDQDDDDNIGPLPPVPAPIVGGVVKSYTLTDVKLHNTKSSCWTAVNGSVYDVTSWISRHPGGSAAIAGMCGVDASSAFNGQHGGQARPASELASFKIGVLK